MKRRSLLATAPLAAAAMALGTEARAQVRDAALQAQIETYLNNVTTLKARFLQVAPDGRNSQGTAWLQRPGRMRFEYDPPSPLLLVASNGTLVFHDSQLGQTSNIPLSQTPLGILLADRVQLSGPVKVTALAHTPGVVTVTLVRAASVADGSLTLVFADNPLGLRQWKVLDAQQQETRVTLYDEQLGGRFPESLFDLAVAGGPKSGG